MMSRPDWNDAPDWANYVAMDADGDWWWYEGKPEQMQQSWRGPEKMRVREAQPLLEIWSESLEERP